MLPRQQVGEERGEGKGLVRGEGEEEGGVAVVGEMEMRGEGKGGGSSGGSSGGWWR